MMLLTFCTKYRQRSSLHRTSLHDNTSTSFTYSSFWCKNEWANCRQWSV